MKLFFTYYHYKKNSEGDKIWNPHDSTGDCNITDVVIHFANAAVLFTSGKKIRVNAYKRIQAAYKLCTGKTLK